MLGVVLWSDTSDRKAVIWCEDQGDLAYVNTKDDVLQPEEFFDAGDLVQFDMEMFQSMRLANNPRLVIERAGDVLPQILKKDAEAPVVDRVDDQTGAKIIPFIPTNPMADRAG